MADHVAPERDLIPASLRARLYPTIMALFPLLAAYGVIEENKVALWSALAVALVGQATATAYRPKP